MKLAQPFYTLKDIEGLTHLHSTPGEAPFVRGPYPEMYRQKPWTIRQYAGYASPNQTNAAFKKALAAGGQGLSVAFDLPTHLGFDSDHPTATADVGRTGVAIDSVEDMKRLFMGIDLTEVSVSMTMSGAVLPILAAFIVTAEESGVKPEKLRGTIQNDILKEFMVRNTYIFEPEFSMRITADVVDYLNHELPLFNSMSISGYHFQEAGAEPALELALTLANAYAYLDRFSERDLELDEICPRLSFFFGLGMNFFEEIAKLRAARMLWSRKLEQLGAKSSKAKRMKIHCQTSGWSLTATDPYNNIIRTSIEAMAGVFGGTQSLHTNAFDEAIGLPTDFSAQLARNTQLIMQHEANICDIADPWGGSYMMESLTDKLAKKVLVYLTEIQDQGGIIAAQQSGWVTTQIHKNALSTQGKIDAGEHKIVGINCFESNIKNVHEPLQINSSDLLAMQHNQIREVKRNRNAKAVKVALDELSRSALDSKENLLEWTIKAIRARATIGECTSALLQNSPRYQAKICFAKNTYRQARENDVRWQKAIKTVGSLENKFNKKPNILMAKLGLDGHDRGIKTVSAGLRDAGFNVELGDLFTSPEQISALLDKKEYDALGISILSGAHLILVDRLINQIKKESKRPIPPIFLGGIIPEQDGPDLLKKGISAIFQPNTPIENIVCEICSNLSGSTPT